MRLRVKPVISTPVVSIFASLALVVATVTIMPSRARADAACEKKIGDTGMFFQKSDPKSICEQKPSVATQDCLVELLNKGKGKLRNMDLMNIYGMCRVDPSKEVRDCFVSKLGSAWNDPSYKPAEKITEECFRERKRFAKLKYKSKPTATPAPAKKQ